MKNSKEYMLKYYHANKEKYWNNDKAIAKRVKRNAARRAMERKY